MKSLKNNIISILLNILLLPMYIVMIIVYLTAPKTYREECEEEYRRRNK